MKQKVELLSVLFLAFFNINVNAQVMQGDVDSDNQVTEADITSIVDYILGNSNISKEAADVNKDGFVTVVDICTLVNIITERKKITHTLTSGSPKEVTAILEEISGTDRIDATAVVTMLQDNPDVEEALSEDGNNVVVKMKDSECRIIYPIYEIGDILSDFDTFLQDFQIASASTRAHHQGGFYNGKVAIFNHFNGLPGYRLQNRIVSNIKVMFELNGYDVAYYGTNQSNEYNGNIDYEQFFDHEHLNDVINHSDEYSAILIFSHGFESNGRSFFATGEKVKTAPNEGYYIFQKEDGEYYYNYPVDALKTDNRCILYLGSCFGIPTGGLGGSSFVEKKNSCFIGWDGKNRVAQADAMVLFNYMIVEGLTLDQAISCSYNRDPWNSGTQRFEYNTANHSLTGNSMPNYDNNRSLYISINKSIYRKEDNKTYIELLIKAEGEWDFPALIRIRLESLLNTGSKPKYEQFIGYLFPNKQQVAHLVLDNNTEEDLLNIYAQTLVDWKWQRVRLSHPQSILYSNNVSDNYSTPVPPESKIRKPVILDSNGQVVTEISIAAGRRKDAIFTIDAFSEHTLELINFDESICRGILRNTEIELIGIGGGVAHIGVYDKQNRQTVVVEVAVMENKIAPGSDSCPDDHHPHMIDLGLPSGTKWACCNEGAEKPEDYGEYFIIGKISSAPTLDQINELLDNTTSVWTTLNGVNGRRFVGCNGGYIFLPAAGWYNSGGLYGNDTGGAYLSSMIKEADTDYVYDLSFNSNYSYQGSSYRYNRRSVRSVSK